MRTDVRTDMVIFVTYASAPKARDRRKTEIRRKKGETGRVCSIKERRKEERLN
jgi:hypothetical protein